MRVWREKLRLPAECGQDVSEVLPLRAAEFQLTDTYIGERFQLTLFIADLGLQICRRS